MITLKPITITSPEMPTCIALDVAPHKEDFVRTNAVSLACQYYDGKKGEPIECRAIYDNQQMVGLVTYYYHTNDPVFEEPCYRIRTIMVDKNHQDKGIEGLALQLAVEEIETKPHGEATAIFATYDPEEEDFAQVYAAGGFTATDMNWDAKDPDTKDVITRRAL